ncbi:hypothetical protein GYMLUDRAFT_215480 [Collybiopsis luxurians FD-317 M1]|nr:hypothetical protein GYMLUDRAFT_215480 [Collybiopsis luxurians FD-317 M1]
MSVQKALIVPQKQGQFVLSTRSIPTPNPGEILVKVKAISLNPIDWKSQTLGYLINEYPAVLGVDVAGGVDSVGEGVKGFEKGDRVLFQGSTMRTADYGAYQEYVLAGADTVAKIPGNLTYSQAATIPLTLATAAVGLYANAPSGAGLNPTWDPEIKYQGHSALIIGGSSSVGHFAIQLLRLVGFTNIVAYASATHTENLKRLGATRIIDRKQVAESELGTIVDQILGGRARLNIVYDAVMSAEGQAAGYASLSDNGHLLSVRAIPDAYEPQDEQEKRGRKVISVFGSPHLPTTQTFGKIMYEKIGKLIEDGTIVPTKTEELPGGLESIENGLSRLREGTVSGRKLVVNL